MAVGDNIKRLRTEQKLSLEELAIYADVSKQTIQRYEGNRRKPQPETLLLLAKKLGVSCEELITGEPPATQTAPKQ